MISAVVDAVVDAAKEAARNEYKSERTKTGEASPSSSNDDDVKEKVEAAGVEAAKLEFARIKAKAEGIEAEKEISKFKDRLEEEGLSSDIETVGGQAAIEEYSRLKAAEEKLAVLIFAVEEAARKAAKEMFEKLQESDNDNSRMPGDTLSLLERDNARKADVEKAGFEAAETEYARLKAAEEETLSALGPLGEEAWAAAEKEERQKVEMAGRSASQKE